MKLSMHMMAWYLRDYSPSVSISGDAISIRGLRFLSDSTADPDPDYIYFGAARYYFSDRQYENSYIAVHRRNHLLFYSADYEDLLNSILSSFDFFNDWERRMLELSSHRGSLQDILDVAAEVIRNPCILGSLDSSSRYARILPEKPLADPYWMSNYSSPDPHPAISSDPYYTVSGELIRDLTAEPVLVRNVYPDGHPVLMMYLFQNEEAIACLAILQADESLTEMNLQIAPVVGKYLSLAEEFTSENAVTRSGEMIMHSLLSGQLPEDDSRKALSEAVRKRGLGESWRLVLIHHLIREDRIQKRTLLSLLRKEPLTFMPLEYENNILTLVPDSASSSLQTLLQPHIHLGQFSIAMSMVSFDLFSMPDCYRQAQFTLGKANGKPGIFKCEDFAFDYLIRTFRSQDLATQLLHPALKILSQYDKVNKTDLEASLEAYLSCDRNLIRTAETLHIHRNTMKYRLKRIRELAGVTLQDERELQYLRLSFWLSSQDDNSSA